MLTAVVLALSALASTRLFAIETGYGEDPVPNAHRFNGSICLGYGVDPIPINSPRERWTTWRAQRGLPPTLRTPARHAEQPPAASSRTVAAPPTTERPKTSRGRSDRQAAQPKRIGR